MSRRAAAGLGATLLASTAIAFSVSMLSHSDVKAATAESPKLENEATEAPNYTPVIDASGELATRDGRVILIYTGSVQPKDMPEAVNPSERAPDRVLENGRVSVGVASAPAADQIDAMLKAGYAKLVPVDDPSLDVYCDRSALADRSCQIGSNAKTSAAR